MSPITLFISVLVVVFGAVDPSNRCDQIPLGHVNYADWLRYSPFYFYLSTEAEYNCTTTQFVGPAGTNTDYTGTCIIVNGNKALTYDLTLSNNNSIVNVHLCGDGVRGAYRVLFSNLYSRGNASVCVFMCDSQGLDIDLIACSGRTPEDAAYMKSYLDTKLNVKITRPVYNSQLNCPKPKSCVAYT